MIRTLAFLTIAFILIWACNDNAADTATERKNGYTPVLKDKGDSLYHEVMKGHDTGMAKWGQLTGAIKKVDAGIDSIAKSKKPDTQFQSTLKTLQEDLTQAEYGMNTWMTEFKADTLQDDKDKRATYLEAELMKVNKVKERILTSLARFDSLYKK